MLSTVTSPLNPAQYPLSTALYEALNSWKPGKSRVRPATIAAACVLVTGEETTGRAAAQATGVTERTFYRFRSGNTGKILFAKLTRMHRENAGQCAIWRIIQLSEQDDNPAVSMWASEWLANFAGVAPKSYVEDLGVVVPHRRIPGIALPGSVESDWLDQLIDPSKSKPSIR